MTIAIIVHGGAGAWKLEEERIVEAVAACEQAASAGRDVLVAGGSSMDAVEAAVCILEDSPVLDAGRGSYLNSEGQIEMDAIVMDGRTLALGAVGAVQRVRHPISLARRVLSESKHNLLVAHGADAFAEKINFPRCDITELLAGEELERFHALQADPDYDLQAMISGEGQMGTVGAVALDSHGDVAAATSTGGTRLKAPGRVGDTPLVGSGAYADNWHGAASATGYGEDLMKVLISKRVCDFIANGLPAANACQAAVQVLSERVGGHGGIIAVDARGNVGFAYNTVAMPHAWATGDGSVTSGH
ncbi:MAG: isoaspartyl peptidase/L-asparaginase [Anaerolineae bacterium]|nr:isoaspartyl peptidase/L-asparaginase [Anaerolineae bacterium]